MQSNELKFKGQSIYVGIDVHFKSWTVSILTEKLHHKTFSQPPSMEARTLLRSRDSIVVVEELLD